jgi:hypothetical protein
LRRAEMPRPRFYEADDVSPRGAVGVRACLQRATMLRATVDNMENR